MVEVVVGSTERADLLILNNDLFLFENDPWLIAFPISKCFFPSKVGIALNQTFKSPVQFKSVSAL